MTKRLEEILENIPNTEIFADVGCDHGYIAESMLCLGKCKKVIASDISEKCLEKAKKRLKKYIDKRLAECIMSDGMKDILYADTVLIAGMGGEEIVSIINDSPFMPKRFILNPMKNSEKVRDVLVGNGFKIYRDYTFRDGKIFYNLICAEKGKDALTEDEREFGRTNINEKPKDFIDMLMAEIDKLNGYLSAPNIGEKSVLEIKNRIERLKKYV